MGEKSRTQYSARNTSIALISRILAIGLGYITRVIFTRQLGAAYAGINGLFIDILNVLALSELGIGTAITYALYEPIARGDIEKQKSLMQLFRKLYQGVAAILLLAGLAVIPFLPILAPGGEQIPHLTLIYLLYLVNSAVSYLFIYKRLLLDACQLSYIGVLYQMCFLAVQYLCQIIVLLVWKNYYVYLLLALGCTVGNNLLIARRANRDYPFLKEKNVKPLAKEERSTIKKNIGAMLMHKIGNVVINNTDNILMSIMLGIISVGQYANNYLIIGSVRQMTNQAFQGITASVGNLGVTEEKEKVKRIFEASFFAGQWIFGFCSITLWELLSPFVSFSFGKAYVLDASVVLILCVNFYITGMRQATLVFRDSMGLFWYDRFKAPIEAALNLIFSIIFAWKFGMFGIFLGTFVSAMLTSFWVEPYILYKKCLKEGLGYYFLRYGIYTLGVLLSGVITDWVGNLYHGTDWMVFLYRVPVCILIPNGIFWVLYHRTKEFRLLWEKAKHLWAGWRYKDSATNETELLSAGQEAFLDALRSALGNDALGNSSEDFDWESVTKQGAAHRVLPFLYDWMEEKQAPPQLVMQAQRAAVQTVQQSYHLLYRTYQVMSSLEENGIQTVVMKGVAAASYYPIPELRKSGDIDLLLLNEAELEQASSCLTRIGFMQQEEQHANHHVVFANAEGIELELHTMLAEPFDNQQTNQFLEKCLQEIPNHISKKEIMGYSFTVLSDGYMAYSLLLHMLQHFLRAGFGVKLLCDWVVFWKQEIAEEEIALYKCLVQESGLIGFAQMVTSVCIMRLGLEKKAALFLKEDYEKYGYQKKEFVHVSAKQMLLFIHDVLEGEEFGRGGENRMVVLRGSGILAFVREFHHQMRLNYLRASRIVILWPILWIATLVRFLWNNKTVRKTSSRAIFKQAKMRSKIMKEMRLFER